MMEIRLNLYQADRDFQVEIGGGGFGYRLFGPKFDGSSRLIKSVILSERDKEEIIRFVKPDAQAVEREKDEELAWIMNRNFDLERMWNASERYAKHCVTSIKETEAALSAAQGITGSSGRQSKR